MWVVHVDCQGHRQEYHCASEAQARALETTLIAQHRAEHARRLR
ncbi:MAG: hypothetical protein ACOZQL_01605 [Myxococcota bacterium]